MCDLPTGLRRTPRYQIGSVAFDGANLEEVVACFCETAQISARNTEEKPGLSVHFANAYTVALADASDQYAKVLDNADCVFMDGQSVVWAAKYLHKSKIRGITRVYGPDVMRGVLARSRDSERHFLLGSTDKVLSRLQENIARGFPMARVVGSYSPPFNDVIDYREVATRDATIASARPTHIWVGLGTPKQDFEVARLAQRHRSVVFGVGAAFDFLSGNTPEAPAFIQGAGLQWAHRLAHEPRRLAARYLWGNSRFLWSVARQALGSERAGT